MAKKPRETRKHEMVVPRARRVRPKASPANSPAVKSVARKLIIKSNLSPGDIMTLTAAIESLHATYPKQFITDVRTPAREIWENNPHITRLNESDAETIEVGYPIIHKSNHRSVAFLEGYTAHLGEKLNLPLRLTTNRPHLYLSEDEKRWLNQVRDSFPELAQRDVPFWLVNAGVKSDYTAKQWPVEYYQEVIKKTCGRIQWVQIGSKDHDHPQLRGVLDLRGKTTHRQLIRLAWHAKGGLGPVTYLQHLMAAWEKPYCCILGGREPVPWVQYPLQQTFHTIGLLPCCRTGACWKSRVVPLNDKDQKNSDLCHKPVLGFDRPVAQCMARIKPDEVVQVLLRIAVGQME